MSTWATRVAGIVAGAVGGAIVAAGVIVIGASVFWLFVFGDDPWPSWAEVALVVAGYGAGFVVFASVAIVMWRRA
jgi:hypothetical protein